MLVKECKNFQQVQETVKYLKKTQNSPAFILHNVTDKKRKTLAHTQDYVFTPDNKKEEFQ